MKYNTKKAATLLDTVLEMYFGVSKQKAKQIITHSEFIVDGKKIDKHPLQIIEAGKTIEIVKESKSNQNKLPNRNNPVAIYFEDNYFIVALKPAGILSCGDKSNLNNKTFHKLLENFLFGRDEKKKRLWIIHRLDKEVEGLIMFAKNEEMQEVMKENWSTVNKKYLALCENRPKQDSGFLEGWLKEGQHQKVMSFSKEIEGSKFAKTEFQYIRQEKSFHLIELKLHTGRKNQIRVQLSDIGCPIVGDRKYGADDSVKRQVRLAAYYLEFIHPVAEEKIILEYKPISRFFNPSKNEDENYKIV
jgi:23S rRNA pseudouridine1911/1915/1917 synthase